MNEDKGEEKNGNGEDQMSTNKKKEARLNYYMFIARKKMFQNF